MNTVLKKAAPVAALLLSCGLAACDSSRGPDVGADSEALRQALLAADAAFSEVAITEGLDVAYERYIAFDAVQLPDGGLPLEGKDAIMSNVDSVVSGNEFNLSWQALDAAVAASGDLGYTWGNYYLEGLDIDGQPYVADGKYLNVWRYTEAAGWQVLLDMSNQNEPPYLDEFEFDLDLLPLDSDLEGNPDVGDPESGAWQDQPDGSGNTLP